MHPAPPFARRADSIAIAILGADTMLAALPATPVQVAHACLAAGYGIAVPASWGDELLAAECLRQLADRGPRPAVMCACPLVREQLLAVGPDLAPVLVSLVPPPVAVARYLHALYGRDRLHLTYIGDCPGAIDEAIDASESPSGFLSLLAAARISVTDQPRVFESVIPPDRRRFYSVAGGVPSAEQLWSVGNGRSLVELDGEDYLIDLAQHLLSHECALIDLAPRLGCACSGASAAIPARSARAAVAVIEPPRAASAVIDVAIAVDVLRPVEARTADSNAESGETGATGRTGETQPDTARPPADAAEEMGRGTHGGEDASRRRSLASGARAWYRGVPKTRIAGRTLPRAYVAKRRPGAVPQAEPVAQLPVTRPPVQPPAESGVEDPTRSRMPARVAAAARSHEDRPTAKSIAAAAAGAPEKMSDGPRS